MTPENFAHTPEEASPVESFEDSRELPKTATVEAKIQEIFEQSAESPTGISAENEEKIKELKRSIALEQSDHLINKTLAKKDDGSERWVDERAAEEKQHFAEEQRPAKKVSGFRKIALALGFAFAGLTGQAAANHEKNPNDSTQREKITQIENRQEVAGITLEGMISVPMKDTTADYYFMGFSGDDREDHKIDKMKEAVKKLGFDLASPEELREALEQHGQKLIKATGGYGISLKEIQPDVDDTKNPIINNVTTGPETHILTTFNPTGKMGQYEVEAIEKLGFSYSEYPVFVKKKKSEQTTANYTDFVKKQ